MEQATETKHLYSLPVFSPVFNLRRQKFFIYIFEHQCHVGNSTM
jgi:hypothetical protein